MCEQLAQGRFMKVERPGIEPAAALTITWPRHIYILQRVNCFTAERRMVFVRPFIKRVLISPHQFTDCCSCFHSPGPYTWVWPCSFSTGFLGFSFKLKVYNCLYGGLFLECCKMFAIAILATPFAKPCHVLVSPHPEGRKRIE